MVNKKKTFIKNRKIRKTSKKIKKKVNFSKNKKRKISLLGGMNNSDMLVCNKEKSNGKKIYLGKLYKKKLILQNSGEIFQCRKVITFKMINGKKDRKRRFKWKKLEIDFEENDKPINYLEDEFSEDVSILGKGAYGEVLKRTVKQKDFVKVNRLSDLDVAVKKVKGSIDPIQSDKETKALYDERNALIAIGFHINIVKLIGFVEKPLMLVIELCNLGSLEDIVYLNKKRGQVVELSSKNVNKMCLDVASGMEHIHKKNYVHRDLAGRNVLVSNDGNLITYKVADFGLTQPKGEDGKYIPNGPETMNIQSLSPHFIKSNYYDERTDIWSYLCLLVEICNGVRPWSEKKLSELDLYKFLKSVNQSEFPSIKSEDSSFTKLIEVYQYIKSIYYQEDSDLSFAKIIEMLV